MSDGKKLHDEGMKLYRSGEYEQAAAKFLEAQQAYASVSDRANEAECANNRGVCWRQAARWEEGTAAFTEARSIFKAINDLKGEGQVVGNMGMLADSQGNKDQAADYYLESIDLLKQAGAKDLAQSVYQALSSLRLKRGDVMGSIGAFDAGLEQLDKPNMVQRFVRRMLSGSNKKVEPTKGEPSAKADGDQS